MAGYAETHTPLDPTKLEWADYAVVQAYCGNLSGNEFTCNLSGNFHPQLSQLAEPLWPDPGIKFGISVRELISTSKHQQKSAGGGMNGRTFSPKASQEREKPPPPGYHFYQRPRCLCHDTGTIPCTHNNEDREFGHLPSNPFCSDETTRYAYVIERVD